jgi:ABC-2 type transport system permease protein
MTRPHTAVIRDTLTLAGRMLKHNIRSADTIMTVLAMPIMILLAFVYVLGGAMDTGPIRSVNYVVPVVLLMCIASGIAYTAFRVNLDVTSGMYARLRTMPIARSALVGGHILASVIVNSLSVVVLLAVAFGVGYRPNASLAGWAITVSILVATVVAFSVMGVFFGLAAKTNEGAGMFSYLLMGLLFVSSGFAPTDTMPRPLRAFADHQPLTPIINAIRDSQLGQIDSSGLWIALSWLGGIIVVFAALAGLANGRIASRRL